MPVADAKEDKVLKVDEKFTDQQIADLFKRFDVTNNNGLLSLAEIDKAVIELYPAMSSNKDAIRRAYVVSDLSKDGFITVDEFRGLLSYLAYYHKLYEAFKVMDKNSDRRIDFAEFSKGHELMGIKADEKDLRKDFDGVDINKGGFILFDEYCHWMSHKYGRPGKSKKSDLISPRGKVEKAKPKKAIGCWNFMHLKSSKVHNK